MIFWSSKKRNQTKAHEIEVSVTGIFDRRLLKDSFTLNLSEETLLEEIFPLIDKKLRTNLFVKFKDNFPANWIVLVNGDKIDCTVKNTTILKNKDQLSILSALGGG